MIGIGNLIKHLIGGAVDTVDIPVRQTPVTPLLQVGVVDIHV